MLAFMLIRHLKVQELRHALATRRGDKIIDKENLMNFDRLVRSCAGLVTVDKESQIVRLVHQKAQEFLAGPVDISQMLTPYLLQRVLHSFASTSSPEGLAISIQLVHSRT